LLPSIKGVRSHAIIEQGLQINENLKHRGACGCEKNTGDGAGILIQVPDRFLRRVCSERDIELPEAGRYGVGMVFLPPDISQRRAIEDICRLMIEAEGQKCLGFRKVPTDNSTIGQTARSEEPVVKQLFVDGEKRLLLSWSLSGSSISSGAVSPSGSSIRPLFSEAIISMSAACRPGPWLQGNAPARAGRRLLSGAARSGHGERHCHGALPFSTNTFPSWDRAHPYRFLSHNGEINTLKGNVNWMEGP